MKRSITIITGLLISLTSFGQWTTLITDPAGDDSGWGGSGPGLDGTVLEFQYDATNDKLMFRITCPNLSTYADSPSADFSFGLPNGLSDGTSSSEHWSSSTTTDLTAVCYTDMGGAPPSNYSYTDTWADNTISSTAYDATYTPLVEYCSSSCVGLNVDVANSQITYSIDRQSIISDADLGGATSVVMPLVVNVGQDQNWSDCITHDLYGASSITITFDIGSSGGGTASINEDEKVNGLQVYPSPTKDILTLSNISMEATAIQVFSLSGRTLLETPVNDKNQTIDVSKLSSGTYMVIVLSINGSRQVEKFVKQ
ncbi:MAG: hypothetical protein COA38_20150 [Fluviicola sp.]|nr:MAG: hypothetical protein COA38_20150 [Fluviicola sp.]